MGVSATERLQFIATMNTSNAVSGFRKLEAEANTSLTKATSKSQAFALKGAAAFSAYAAAGAAGFAVIRSSVNAASALNEVQAKTTTIFGESSSAVMKWSQTAAAAFGQSKRAALDGATAFAVFGKSAGLEGDKLVRFSTKLTELASDMASFHNTSVDEAATALRSGLAGESEPLRRYGVLLNEATLKQRALALGIIETTKTALTPQQRVLAAQAEIFAQTSDAQGDFARTSGGLANSQRTLSASLEDLQATLGKELTPAIAELARQIAEMARVGGPGLGMLAGGFAKVAKYVNPMAYSVNKARSVLGGLWHALPGVSEGGDKVAKTFTTIRAGFDHLEAYRFIAPIERIGALAGGIESVAEAQRDVNVQHQGSKWGEQAAGMKIAERNLQLVEQATIGAKRAAWDLRDAWEALTEPIEQEQTWISVQQGLLGIAEAQRQWTKDAKKHKPTADEEKKHALEMEAARNDQRLAVIAMLDAMGDVPPSIVSEISILIDQGDLDAALAKLAALQAGLTGKKLSTRGGVGGSGLTVGGDIVGGGTRNADGTLQEFDSGGVVRGPRGSRQLVIAHAGETAFIPTHKRGPARGTGTVVNLTVNAGLGTDGYQVGRQIREWLADYDRVAG